MKNTDSKSHLKGESIYLDDIPELQGTLHALVYDSPKAHAKIKSISYKKAEALPGVCKIITYKDIPGENQIGAIIQDEPLLAEDEVHFSGQPIALIIAESERIARDAKKLIDAEFEEYEVVTDPKISKEKNDFIIPPRTFRIGNIEDAENRCKYIIEDEVFIGGQEHLYLETQGAYAIPHEKGNIKLYSSTQGPTSVQKIASEVLNVPMNKIEVDVNRLGGGFGGKEDQATPWACMVTLAASILKKPVKIAVSRHDDIRMTGKRHPYSANYKIGITEDLKIQFYKVEFIQDAGASADLSPAIMERTLFHATGSYSIPNAEITVFSCRTNTPPNTAFRGFGAPQAFFAVEAAINKASEIIGIPAYKLQYKNLIVENYKFPYGQKAEKAESINTWDSLFKKVDAEKRLIDIENFNAENSKFKKGASFIPICFGISFTNTVMNHARALVHVYQDGSIGISTGAIEMGQAVNTKIMQVAAKTFSVDINRIKIESTNTTRVANTSPTAASTGADLNGKATQIACTELNQRLIQAASEILNAEINDISIQDEAIYLKNKKTDLHWEKLVETAFLKRVKLSEKGHYITPEIWFDKTKEKGHPFAYHVYGTAFTEIILDVRRGTYKIESVDIVHDFGRSMNILIDKGQVEGALIQSIGWMTIEEIRFNKEGQLLSNALSTYKVPDIYSAPKTVNVHALETDGAKHAILKSKAVGEPPFIYGIGSYFAILDAIKICRKNPNHQYITPITHEKVLLNLY